MILISNSPFCILFIIIFSESCRTVLLFSHLGGTRGPTSCFSAHLFLDVCVILNLLDFAFTFAGSDFL
ncbi:hypothetical protein EDC96DRAFT_504335 [Choanephora cucurbitarum]|nr:hypothetical protein EDC96DRAFT_504335 [Choanephora cucurbitarum]